MKKRIVFIVIAVLLLYCCTASAGSFQLRNGIQSGDSPDAVKAKETLALEKEDENELVYKGIILDARLSCIIGLTKQITGSRIWNMFISISMRLPQNT